MTFDYLRTVQAMDFIEIPDIGNTCVCAINDDAEEWYLIITTKNGWTNITSFGPLEVDSDDHLKNSFNFNYFERDFEEKKIKKTISDFINNPKHEITQVFEVEKEEAINKFNKIKNRLL